MYAHTVTVHKSHLVTSGNSLETSGDSVGTSGDFSGTRHQKSPACLQNWDIYIPLQLNWTCRQQQGLLLHFFSDRLGSRQASRDKKSAIIFTYNIDLSSGCGDGRGDDWIELDAGLISMVSAENLIREMSHNQKNFEAGDYWGFSKAFLRLPWGFTEAFWCFLRLSEDSPGLSEVSFGIGFWRVREKTFTYLWPPNVRCVPMLAWWASWPSCDENVAREEAHLWVLGRLC